MYLKRLELQGFKTFAPYTEFVFDEGVTAIVGPNGSGKSNIADAVRWVLGEQSYVALRGKRTLDMIFAGTSRRPKLGMAEAAMTFDNASRWLPLDFAEVTITRRAYRSGENRYSVNGSQVRLRDVLEILGQGGLGRRGFVVIGQGLVDAALSLRPEERRVLFEEAAGIHIYKEKRNDALSRLTETHQNILRVNDILNEIEPRMRDLERQARRTEEYELLSHDLEQLLRIWYGHKWHHGQIARMEAEALLERRQNELDLGRARMHELEALISSSQQQQGELRRGLSTWHRESGELHAQAEVTTRELAVNRERLSLLRQRRQELELELTQLRREQTAAHDKVQAATAAQESLQRQVTTRAEQAADCGESWQAAVSTRERLEQRVENARAEVYTLATTLSDARNRSLQLREQRGHVLAERKLRAQQLDESEQQLTHNDEQLTQARSRGEHVLEAQRSAAERETQVQEQLLGLQRELQQQQEILSSASNRLQRLRDRHELLEGLRQSLAGYLSSVRLLMQSSEHLPGIVGPVASLIRSPKRLERAIDAALGRYAQALVVESLEDARRAIDHLRGQAAGWAAFLPLDSIKAPPLKAPPATSGVIGMAHQLVQCEPRFQTIAGLLLGNTIVVEDWNTATRLLGKLHPSHIVVTMSGEIVTPAGLVGGGSASEASLLAQEREWRELPALLSAAQEEHTSAHEALQQLEQQLQAAQTELAAAQAESNQLADEYRAAQRALADLEQKRHTLEQEREWHRRLDAQQARELQALEEKGALLLQEEQRIEQQHASRKAVLDGALAELEAARGGEESARQALSEAETTLAVTERQAKTHGELLSSQASTLARLEGDVGAKSERIKQLDSQVAGLDTQMASLHNQSETLSTALAQLTARIDPAEAELIASESQILQLEEELSLARRRLTELQTLYNQQLLERERRQDDLRSLEQRIEEDLGDIEYPSERVQQLRLEFVGQGGHLAPPVPVLPENIGSDIRDLKARITRLGSINPNAPQEYREVRERFGFLQSQIADLEESAVSIQQVIKELDRLIEDEFLSVFEVAAKEFSNYFKVLFGGGQARLKLTDPDDPASSGVEIFAQPPGRRPQPLAVLSGGERALTATALLFAVLKTRPLPFCLLDEVDAMLDESNVGRFRSLLEEFAEQTQFIVITHNRVTIESARTIYGVSMGEEGVSQVVSLKLPAEQETNSTPA
jgi:chromosome segregation protein